LNAVQHSKFKFYLFDKKDSSFTSLENNVKVDFDTSKASQSKDRFFIQINRKETTRPISENIAIVESNSIIGSNNDTQIQQIDLVQETTLSVSIENSIKQISAFPNPNNQNVVYIDLSVYPSNLSYSLLSANSPVVNSGTLIGKQVNAINIQNLLAGIYFLKLQGEDVTHILKIVRQ